MASTFNINAAVGVTLANVTPVLNTLQRALGNVKAEIQVKMSPDALGNIRNFNVGVKGLNSNLIDTTAIAHKAMSALNTLGASNARLNLPTFSTKIKNVTEQFEKQQVGVNKLNQELASFGNTAGLALRRFTGFMLVSNIMMGTIMAFKKATTSAIKFQDHMMKLGQLTGGTLNDSYRTFGDTIQKLSVTLGVSSEKLVGISNSLAQAGLRGQDMMTVMTALAKTLNAPAFDNIKDTMEGTIAMMAQFKVRAGEVENALGAMHAIAAATAVESGDLVNAIKIAGGTFATMSPNVKDANEKLAQFMAIFTSVRATTRESAESIATGLKTIFARLERPQNINSLKQLGVDLVDTEGKFIGAYNAIEQISEAVKKIPAGDTRLFQLGEDLGGYRQMSKILPALLETQKRHEALNIAKRSSGVLDVVNARAQESWAVQLTKTHERFLALIRDLSKTDTFKTIIDLAIKGANAFIGLAESIKPIIPLLAVLGGMKLLQFATIASGVGNAGQGPGFIRGLLGHINPFRRAGGGHIPGVGTGDIVPAMLEPGEFVINKRAAQEIGTVGLNRLNAGGIEHFATGKQVRGPGGRFISNKPAPIAIPSEKSSSSEGIVLSGGTTSINAQGATLILSGNVGAPQVGGGKIIMPTDTLQPGSRHVDSPESQDYIKRGGWKMHLAVDPKNAPAVDQWLDKNHPGQYKYLNNSGQENKDFTVYTGSKDATKKLAYLMQSQLADKLKDVPNVSEDIKLNDKVNARFDARQAGYGYYGVAGVPRDQRAGETAYSARLAKMSGDVNAQQYWEGRSQKSDTRVHRELVDKYGEYYTGSKLALPISEPFNRAEMQALAGRGGSSIGTYNISTSPNSPRRSLPTSDISDTDMLTTPGIGLSNVNVGQTGAYEKFIRQRQRKLRSNIVPLQSILNKSDNYLSLSTDMNIAKEAFFQGGSPGSGIEVPDFTNFDDMKRPGFAKRNLPTLSKLGSKLGGLTGFGGGGGSGGGGGGGGGGSGPPIGPGGGVPSVGGIGGRLAKIGGKLGGAAMPMMLAGMAVESMLPKNEYTGALSSGLSMAGTGAMIGSVIPGVGTAIGAGVGAIAGGVSGFMGAKEQKARDDLAKAIESSSKQLTSSLTNLDNAFNQMIQGGSIKAVNDAFISVANGVNLQRQLDIKKNATDQDVNPTGIWNHISSTIRNNAKLNILDEKNFGGTKQENFTDYQKIYAYNLQKAAGAKNGMVDNTREIGGEIGRAKREAMIMTQQSEMERQKPMADFAAKYFSQQIEGGATVGGLAGRPENQKYISAYMSNFGLEKQKNAIYEQRYVKGNEVAAQKLEIKYWKDLMKPAEDLRQKFLNLCDATALSAAEFAAYNTSMENSTASMERISQKGAAQLSFMDTMLSGGASAFIGVPMTNKFANPNAYNPADLAKTFENMTGGSSIASQAMLGVGNMREALPDIIQQISKAGNASEIQKAMLPYLEQMPANMAAELKGEFDRMFEGKGNTHRTYTGGEFIREGNVEKLYGMAENKVKPSYEFARGALDKVNQQQEKRNNLLQKEHSIITQMNQLSVERAEKMAGQSTMLKGVLQPGVPLTIEEATRGSRARMQTKAGQAGLESEQYNDIGAISGRITMLRSQAEGLAGQLENMNKLSSSNPALTNNKDETLRQLEKVNQQLAAANSLVGDIKSDAGIQTAILSELNDISKKREAAQDSLINMITMGPAQQMQMNRNARQFDLFQASGILPGTTKAREEVVAGFRERIPQEDPGWEQQQRSKLAIARAREGRLPFPIRAEALTMPGKSTKEQDLMDQLRANNKLQNRAGKLELEIKSKDLDLIQQNTNNTVIWIQQLLKEVQKPGSSAKIASAGGANGGFGGGFGGGLASIPAEKVPRLEGGMGGGMGGGFIAGNVPVEKIPKSRREILAGRQRVIEMQMLSDKDRQKAKITKEEDIAKNALQKQKEEADSQANLKKFSSFEYWHGDEPKINKDLGIGDYETVPNWAGKRYTKEQRDKQKIPMFSKQGTYQSGEISSIGSARRLDLLKRHPTWTDENVNWLDLPEIHGLSNKEKSVSGPGVLSDKMISTIQQGGGNILRGIGGAFKKVFPSTLSNRSNTSDFRPRPDDFDMWAMADEQGKIPGQGFRKESFNSQNLPRPNPPGMPKRTTINDIQGGVSNMMTGVKDILSIFTNSISNLSKINIPSTISLDGKHTFTHNVVGTDAIGKAIVDEVAGYIAEYVANEIGKVVGITGETTPPNVATPMKGGRSYV